MTYDADELLGGQLGDELGEPVDLSGLAVLIGGLGQDVNLNTGSDEGTNCGNVLGERLEVCHGLTLAGSGLVKSIGLVEVCEDAVHVEVVSHFLYLPHLMALL